jgi:crotonobetainyl-CoA:carnitine CoA-transferase CaiB-like acyl-CoA transferase
VEECRRAGVPAALVRDLAALFAAPETAALIEEIADPVRGTLRLVRSPITGIGGGASLPPPRLGEHTAEVRRHLWG